MAEGDYFVNGIKVRADGAVYTTTTANMADLANTSDAAKGDALIGVKLSATGSVATTQHEVNERFFNVFDFIGNDLSSAARLTLLAAIKARTNTTTLTAYIQAGITAVNVAGGGVLYFPSGTYYLASALVFKTTVSLIGQGNGVSIIKGDGIIGNHINDESIALADIEITSLGFDWNGYNTANFGTALSMNSPSHTRINVHHCRFFDSNYPGDATVKQRQGVFIGGAAESIWVQDNDCNHGARIKVGRGGKNVWINRNKLSFINDNAITMAMLGTVAVPLGDYSENVHIEDNTIINPKGCGVFVGADGATADDPAVYIKRLSISRNIILLDSANVGSSPIGVNFSVPAGGAEDVSIDNNITIKTSNSTASGNDNGIAVQSVNNMVGTVDRLSILDNKLFASQTTSNAAVYYAVATVAANDLNISGNTWSGYDHGVWINTAATLNRPTVNNNTGRNNNRSLRVSGNPTVVSGSYCWNRVFTPADGNFFSSTAAMEWRIEGNDILDSAGDAIDVAGAGTKDFYIIGNDLRGAASGPLVFSSSGVLSATSIVKDNLGLDAPMKVNTTAVGNVGGGTDVLMTHDLITNTLSVVGKGVSVVQSGITANNSNPKTLVSQVGGQTLVSQALTVSIAGEWMIEYDLVSTGVDTQRYVGRLTWESAAGVWATVLFKGTLALNDGAAITVRCTGTVTDGGGGINNDDIVQEYLRIQYP